MSKRRPSIGSAATGIGRAIGRFGPPWWRRGRSRPGPSSPDQRPEAPDASSPQLEADPPRGVHPLRPRMDERPGARCVLAVVVGLPRDDLAGVVAQLSRASGSIAVFLTDDDRFEVFRSHRAPFEYLPPVEPRPGLDWDLYRLRRLALLRRKWQPARIVAFGTAAVGLVDAWRRSPFEDQGILELTGTPAASGTKAGRR